jgi:tRNA A-37 threonylcarbamoyl transferase component Bud32
MEADAPLDGAVLLGDRYTLGDLVGRGGMAQVYRAHDRVLDRMVAVKVMRAIVAGEEERARFTDEARMLARLSHPGLVTVLDAASNDDEPYLVMELVDGPSLAERCRGVAIEPERVAAIGAQIADALGHVHAAGIVHRDLKPGNVLLGTDGRALLTDFGLARIISAAMRHTTTGTMVGTPAYLAPEQVRGEELTPAVDVYSLGLVLIEALTGVCPYQGLPVEAALARLTTPPTIPADLPRPWRVLLRAMTALDPSDRPSTTEVAEALRRLASGSESAPGLGGVVHRWHLAVGAAAGALLVLLTSMWYGRDPGLDQPRPAVTAQRGPGGVVDDQQAPRIAMIGMARMNARAETASVTSRAGNHADAPPDATQVQAVETGAAMVTTDPARAIDQPQAASGDDVMTDDDVATDDEPVAETADPTTLSTGSTDDDRAVDAPGAVANDNAEANREANAAATAKAKRNARPEAQAKR